MDDGLDPGQRVAAAERFERLAEVSDIGAEETGSDSRDWLDSGEPTWSMLRTWWPRANQVADDNAAGLAAAAGDCDLGHARSSSRPAPPLGLPRIEPERRTIVFFPEGAFRSHQQLRGHRRRAAPPRPPGGVRDRGVLRRDARGQGVRGAAHAPLGPATDPREAGTVLEGLHPRHTAPVFHSSTQEQLGGFILPTWQAPGRRAHATSTSASPRSSTSSRPTPSSRTTCARSPAILASGRPWVRIVFLQSAGGHRPRSAAHLLGPGARRPHQLGGVPRGVRDAGRRSAGVVLGVLR